MKAIVYHENTTSTYNNVVKFEWLKDRIVIFTEEPNSKQRCKITIKNYLTWRLEE